MTHWIYPANTKYYDALGAFSEAETYWPINSNVSAGDTVYIYLAAPYKQIGFVCEVLETGLDKDSIIEKARSFFRNADTHEHKKKSKPFMKPGVSSAIELTGESTLNYYSLRENGLNGMLMGPRKLENNPELLNYILEQF
jgi:hypothetical protein